MTLAAHGLRIGGEVTSELDVAARWRWATIECRPEQPILVVRRRLPKWISRWEIRRLERRYHRLVVGDACRLYYDQPHGAPNFLAVKLMISQRNTRYLTIKRCLRALDRIAELRGTDALVCELQNQRLDERVMRRLGWERHAPGLRGVHYIRRFYGDYHVPT